MATALFPRKGDRLRAHSVFFQAIRVAGSGKGIVSGMAPSRASSSSVAIASGSWSNGFMLNSYAGGSITSIPAASAGKHRYDPIVLDTSTGLVSRIAGSEDTPSISTDFLENLQPLPPELESVNQILIAIIIVTSSGIPSGNFGHYSTSGVANLIIEVPDPAHAIRHQLGGLDAIKLDDLAAPDDNTDLDASTSKHGLFPKFPNTKQALVGDKTWATRTWPASFVFGDGSTVILSQEMGIGPFPLACKITEVKIREQALISSTATITLHVHDYNAAIGDAVDSFGLSGASYSETGLNWPVAAGKFVTIKIASPTSAKQLSVGLVFEAT
jgi:hypothetical protein